MDDHTSIDGSCGKIEIATDEKIEEIIEGFIHGAELAAEAGFDCVDVKVCHEYPAGASERLYPSGENSAAALKTARGPCSILSTASADG